METARALSANLASLLRREHDALAEFLVALADFDRRRGWAELGHASLFMYLHRELRLSKAAAQYRKVAAELIQEVPAVVEPLRSGQLCLTSIIEVARVVTADNGEAVLPKFFGLSRREAAVVVAALQPDPAPPVRTVVTAARPVEARAHAGGARDLGLPLVPPQAAPPAASSSSADEPAVPCASAPAARATVDPLTADQRRLHVTVSAAFVRKLEQARAARPDLSEEALLEAGLDLVLQKSAKRKGLVERPRKTPRPAKEDHIPAQVKREVWERDGGCCQFRLESGEICGSTYGLEFNHKRPRALGGASTAENLELACKPHNLELARRIFGDAWMDQWCSPKRRRGRRPKTGSAAAPEVKTPP